LQWHCRRASSRAVNGAAAFPERQMDLLKETNFGFLGPKTAGKVRDIYQRHGKLILITTDRH
jgi:hypothetical protein